MRSNGIASNKNPDSDMLYIIVFRLQHSSTCYKFLILALHMSSIPLAEAGNQNHLLGFISRAITDLHSIFGHPKMRQPSAPCTGDFAMRWPSGACRSDSEHTAFVVCIRHSTSRCPMLRGLSDMRHGQSWLEWSAHSSTYKQSLACPAKIFPDHQ